MPLTYITTTFFRISIFLIILSCNNSVQKKRDEAIKRTVTPQEANRIIDSVAKENGIFKDSSIK